MKQELNWEREKASDEESKKGADALRNGVKECNAMMLEGRTGRYNPLKRTWKEYVVMMFNPLGLNVFNWILYVIFVCGILGVFVLYFHKDDIDAMRAGKKAHGSKYTTGMGHAGAESDPGSGIDGLPSHIQDFMKETGGTNTYTKQYEVSAEEAKKMMEGAVGAGAQVGSVEDLSEEDL